MARATVANPFMNKPLSEATEQQRRETAAAARASAERVNIIGEVLRERSHQIRCGHTPLRDGAHALGELSQAAMACIAAGDDFGEQGLTLAGILWPFQWEDIPQASTGRRRLLVKAMALLLAELERLPSPERPPPAAPLLPGNGERGQG